MATQKPICKPTRNSSSRASHTCGQDQLVLFQGQAAEACVSGARVLVTGAERKGERLVSWHTQGPHRGERRALKGRPWVSRGQREGSSATWRPHQRHPGSEASAWLGSKPAPEPLETQAGSGGAPGQCHAAAPRPYFGSRGFGRNPLFMQTRPSAMCICGVTEHIFQDWGRNTVEFDSRHIRAEERPSVF